MTVEERAEKILGWRIEGNWCYYIDNPEPFVILEHDDNTWIAVTTLLRESDEKDKTIATLTAELAQAKARIEEMEKVLRFLREWISVDVTTTKPIGMIDKALSHDKEKT